MHTFRIGEQFKFLKEDGYGVIKQVVSDHLYIVEDEFGFERKSTLNELVPIQSENYQLEKIPTYVIETKKSHQKEEKSLFKTSVQPTFKKEIDLHIESLVEFQRGMSNADMLQTQMTAFRQFFYQAIHHHLTKIIVIHGVGEGVLKSEIQYFLDRYEWAELIEYSDASYREYGRGATEIRISPSLFNRI